MDQEIYSDAPTALGRFSRRKVLGVTLAVSNYDAVVAQSVEWAQRRESRSLFFTNVHAVMEAFDDPAFRTVQNSADLVNPDGVPLVWALRLLGESTASRVYGPETTLRALAAAEKHGIPVGFYGGTPEGLDALLHACAQRFPALQVVYSISPPFRKLTYSEDEEITSQIVDSGARFLFIGLGCPKQEIWIHEHKSRIPAVIFGVGAAFDFIAGTKAQAPGWMMKSGLEWVFRLMTEPKRLARRYARHNPRFVIFFLRQLLTGQSN